MFRKPRDTVALTANESPLRPCTGRPPTPPLSIARPAQSSTSPTTYREDVSSSKPLLGRAKTLPKSTPAAPVGKAKGKANGNGNIMSFFKRAESGNGNATASLQEDESLFLNDTLVKAEEKVEPFQTPTPPRDEGFLDDATFFKEESPILRFNEDWVPSKRRKVDETVIIRRESPQGAIEALTKGPFADDSEEEEECIALQEPPQRAIDCEDGETKGGQLTTTSQSDERSVGREDSTQDTAAPPLKREATSIGEFNEFDGIDDFIDDEFPEGGEEFMERRWMEEQESEEELETDRAGALRKSDVCVKESVGSTAVLPDDAGSASCPICGGSTAGLAGQVCRGHPIFKYRLMNQSKSPYTSTIA